MHSRNPYRVPPDFAVLARQYEPLQRHLITTRDGVTINFKDDAAQRCLTEALLFRDFALKLTLPPHRLCPPIPNRLNYILWLEDVVTATALAETSLANGVVRGIDIGTGASAIYPLLGTHDPRSRWVFTATEVDKESLHFARLNISDNGLSDRIQLIQADPSGPILPLAVLDIVAKDGLQYDFTMCNPPFYGSREDVVNSFEAKEYEPAAVCTGADVEMITPGGEAAFVKRMIEESVAAGTSCRWYTSMLGKMSSLAEVVELLHVKEIQNYAITEFIQGQTRRWAIAWSFTDIHLPDSLARISNPASHALMPPHTTVVQPYPRADSAEQLARATMSVLGVTDGLTAHPTNSQVVVAMDGILDILVTAQRETWTRASRRKKGAAMDLDGAATPVLVCRVRCVDAGAEAVKKGERLRMVFDWVRGRDRNLFESFASSVGRKVKASTTTG